MDFPHSWSWEKYLGYVEKSDRALKGIDVGDELRTELVIALREAQ